MKRLTDKDDNPFRTNKTFQPFIVEFDTKDQKPSRVRVDNRKGSILFCTWINPPTDPLLAPASNRLQIKVSDFKEMHKAKQLTYLRYAKYNKV